MESWKDERNNKRGVNSVQRINSRVRAVDAQVTIDTFRGWVRFEREKREREEGRQTECERGDVVLSSLKLLPFTVLGVRKREKIGKRKRKTKEPLEVVVTTAVGIQSVEPKSSNNHIVIVASFEAVIRSL